MKVIIVPAARDTYPRLLEGGVYIINTSRGVNSPLVNKA